MEIAKMVFCIHRMSQLKRSIFYLLVLILLGSLLLVSCKEASREVPEEIVKSTNEPNTEKGQAVSDFLDSMRSPEEDSEAYAELTSLLNASDTNDIKTIRKAGDVLYLKIRDKEKSLKWYLKGAAKDDPYCQFMVYDIYRLGPPNLRSPKDAFSYCRQSALNGYDSAMINLGQMYEEGFGTSKCDKNAFFWYSKSSKINHGCAYKAATMLLEGKGTIKDDTEGFNRILELAEDGHSRSWMLAAALYEDGVGTERNLSESYRWLLVAQSYGSNYAAEEVYRLERKLSKQERLEGQKLAKGYETPMDEALRNMESAVEMLKSK